MADVFGPALNVAILVFDDVEVLDFAGPFEVFSRCRMQPGVESRRSNDGAPFNVYCVARTRAAVAATGGLQIVPHCDFADCPPVDVLVVPGGWGTRALLENRETLSWIERVAASAAKVTSVCTGSLLLAKAGLLDRHLRRLLRIKPGERPDLQDLWEYLQDLRYTDIQNSLLAHRFLSVLNYGVRIYEALATKYGGFVERLYPVLADRAIFDKHLTSKQSAAVSEFIRQTILEEVDDQLGQKHREAANSPPGGGEGSTLTQIR